MAASQNETKNDVAWEVLFERHHILDHIEQQGQYVISSTAINKVRESRLMAKFDHSVNLPRVFRKHQLSILPVSRSEYVIGRFATHAQVRYNPDALVSPAQLPSGLETIDYADLYSEAVALNCAYNAGIIDDLAGERTLHTVSGRMSTDSFAFSIASSVTNQQAYQVRVDKAQCEIDGGYEGDHSFVLVEAKNYAVDDFLIRQLYYPYRLWSSKVSKRVVPVLMTLSQDTFDFFVYEFADPSVYTSLRLVRHQGYAIAPETITAGDVSMLFAQVRALPEPADIPFPQADSFARVVDLIGLLTTRDLTKEEITENYQFDVRQTQYYTDAGRYLGLIEKYTDPATHEVTFTLTDAARLLFKQKPKIKTLELIRKVLEHTVFYEAFGLALASGSIPSKDEISRIIESSNIGIGGSTVGRRSITVRGWLTWIWNQIDE